MAAPPPTAAAASPVATGKPDPAPASAAAEAEPAKTGQTSGIPDPPATPTEPKRRANKRSRMLPTASGVGIGAAAAVATPATATLGGPLSGGSGYAPASVASAAGADAVTTSGGSSGGSGGGGMMPLHSVSRHTATASAQLTAIHDARRSEASNLVSAPPLLLGAAWRARRWRRDRVHYGVPTLGGYRLRTGVWRRPSHV
ncbi:hypothetical protein CXG81DRAFT_27365 [Caulochytrium protostelioides]|uniref:Uncharacterized protein n=1 Tax=Caulochytrium protostelioides TaxID=1555241 RepID=A0A4P9X4C8_9FUNG|nr:hypothetical protein CXG81DRAFT_27365 [Caulochytrium protostelioides]|eukprot:RKO99913.1 hypothetical protein CXG81DRAFT_27365 [Caulochytrium protostelioides]